MGVDLGEVPKKQATIESLGGKTFAVDAYNTIYQFLSSIRQPDGTPLKDLNGNPTGHLAGIFYRNCRLLENGIRPIYVFDGQPPSFKQAELQERDMRKAEAEARWVAALEKGELEEARKAAQATSRISQKIVQESKELLSFMGIPVVQAPSEGEAQAAQLVLEGSATAVASQDMDCLLFGAPTLLRNLSLGGRRKLPGRDEWVEVQPEIIELSDVLSFFGISRQQLIWVGLLVGTDFNEGIKGIGPKKALKLVKDAKSLDEVLQKIGARDLLPIFESAERFFLDPPVERGVKIKFGKFDKDGIVDFLCRKHDFSEDRVLKSALLAEKKLKERASQTRLDSWS
ncbi:MAG: flap endonuclease-1 [Candidatus Micrarchaeota archaeon]|nr:flap endonuclease-1 [Candidatus Micrarchaeota archaeon]